MIRFVRSGKTFPVNTYTTIFTLPKDAIPKEDIHCEIWVRDTRIMMYINSSGEVKLKPPSEYGDIQMYTIFTFAK